MDPAASSADRPASRRTVIAMSVGTLIEGYDLLLYGYFAGILAVQFFPTGDPTAALLNTFAIFAVGFAARPVGALVFGHVGDRLGRRSALAGSILGMGAATLAIGLLPTYPQIGRWAPALLLIYRIAQGLSIGGEVVGANILILESAPPHRAARTVSANQVASLAGASAAAATGLLLAATLSPAQLSTWGWRLPFLAAGLLALIGLYVRTRVPDSPAFHAGTPGRARRPLVAALRENKRGMLVYGGWFATASLGGYLLVVYLPSYLTRTLGLHPVAAFGANLAAVLTVGAGAVVGGYLADRYPLRIVAVGCAVGVALTVVPGFVLLRHGGVAAALLGQAIWAVGVGAGLTISALMSLSQFPISARYTAAGFAHNISGTLFGGTAPYLSAWLVSRTGNIIAPAWYLAVVALGSAATVVVGMRKRAGTNGGAETLSRSTLASDQPR